MGVTGHTSTSWELEQNNDDDFKFRVDRFEELPVDQGPREELSTRHEHAGRQTATRRRVSSASIEGRQEHFQYDQRLEQAGYDRNARYQGQDQYLLKGQAAADLSHQHNYPSVDVSIPISVHPARDLCIRHRPEQGHRGRQGQHPYQGERPHSNPQSEYAPESGPPSRPRTSVEYYHSSLIGNANSDDGYKALERRQSLAPSTKSAYSSTASSDYGGLRPQTIGLPVPYQLHRDRLDTPSGYQIPPQQADYAHSPNSFAASRHSPGLHPGRPASYITAGTNTPIYTANQPLPYQYSTQQNSTVHLPPLPQVIEDHLSKLAPSLTPMLARNESLKSLKSTEEMEVNHIKQLERFKQGGSPRTGTACDRCKVRKMSCDVNPQGCSHCTKVNQYCGTTDKNTLRLSVRGELEILQYGILHLRRYATLLENNNKNIVRDATSQIEQLRQQVASLQRSSPSTYQIAVTEIGYPAISPSSSWTGQEFYDSQYVGPGASVPYSGQYAAPVPVPDPTYNQAENLVVQPSITYEDEDLYSNPEPRGGAV